MRVSEVFAHNSYPEYTYVERETGDLETSLENALRMRGAIVSISGPSKSGKSMLVKRVAKQSHITQIAEVTGSNIESVDDLWEEALNNIGAPSATEEHSTEREESGRTVKGGVDVGFSAGADSHSLEGQENTDVSIDQRRGLSRLIEVVDTDNFILLIDDFHYIDQSIQPDIAEAIKGAAERVFPFVQR
ncbi:ATP-binding protein [Halobacterium sp. CBA1126]|uniref:ATP-binding protein n=1 Tax=Halobacterium sp. CBA1126 TaxID=2668074 RepID=UPI0012FBE3C2|nr:ATP-binding protein [Halobacterium sp. CBA1126]MUV61839.1 AAA family ATPase [Halobacterium sp. CBA1126]